MTTLVTADTLRRIARMGSEEARIEMLSILADQLEAEEKRKHGQRERSRRSRANHRDGNVTATSPQRDGHVTAAPPNSPPLPAPSPPLNPPEVLASLESHTREKLSIREFNETFWPRYPNKVGKPKALIAFRTARKVAELAEIMVGLDRYIRDKPPDRQWLNPATFLNQQRFHDQPAAIDGNQGDQQLRPWEGPEHLRGDRKPEAAKLL